MVNDEYIKEIRQKYGRCECGNDVEYVFLKEIHFYHINFIGHLSERSIEPKTELVEALCHKCFYYKKFLDENIKKIMSGYEADSNLNDIKDGFEVNPECFDRIIKKLKLNTNRLKKD